MDFRKRFPLRLWRPAVDDEVNDELEFHLAMRRREFMQLGLTETQATRAALEKFGDYATAREVCRAIGHQRDQRMRIVQYVSELRQDVSFAVRQMLTAPGFTVIAVTTLSIGIGATTAIFSAMDAVVLRPLPVAEPERVVHISASSRVASEIVADMGLPNAHFLELASEQQAFSAVAAMRWASFTVSGDDGAERVSGARVTGSFFEVFHIAPAIGGVFGPAHDTPGSERVVVLSHRLWVQRFGADPSIVGRDILLNQRPHTVLGIMPESFTFTATSEALWVPMAWTAADQAISDEHNLVVVARLRDDVTVAQANEHVAGIAARRRERQPNGPERWLHVSPLLELYVADYRYSRRLSASRQTCGPVAPPSPRHPPSTFRCHNSRTWA